VGGEVGVGVAVGGTVAVAVATGVSVAKTFTATGLLQLITERRRIKKGRSLFFMIACGGIFGLHRSQNEKRHQLIPDERRCVNALTNNGSHVKLYVPEIETLSPEGVFW
jgi:hypothetical protein